MSCLHCLLTDVFPGPAQGPYHQLKDVETESQAPDPWIHDPGCGDRQPDLDKRRGSDGGERDRTIAKDNLAADDDLASMFKPAVMSDPAALYDTETGIDTGGDWEETALVGNDKATAATGPASSWSPRHEAHGAKAAELLLPDQVCEVEV